MNLQPILLDGRETLHCRGASNPSDTRRITRPTIHLIWPKRCSLLNFNTLPNRSATIGQFGLKRSELSALSRLWQSRLATKSQAGYLFGNPNGHPAPKSLKHFNYRLAEIAFLNATSVGCWSSRANKMLAEMLQAIERTFSRARALFFKLNTTNQAWLKAFSISAMAAIAGHSLSGRKRISSGVYPAIAVATFGWKAFTNFWETSKFWLPCLSFSKFLTVSEVGMSSDRDVSGFRRHSPPQDRPFVQPPLSWSVS